MQKATHRGAWLSLATALAVCGAICALLSCVGALDFLLSFAVSDVGHGSWFGTLLTYPAYVFRKWSRAAWQIGVGTGRDWIVSFTVVAALVALLAALFDCTLGWGFAYIVGFAILVSHFFFNRRLPVMSAIGPPVENVRRSAR